MIDAFLHINIAQTLFAAVIILTKKPLNITDKLLSVWLFCVSLFFVIRLINLSFPEIGENQWISGSVITLSFPSFLYLYSKYVTKDKTKFNRLDLLHFIPPLIFVFYILISLLNYPGLYLGFDMNTININLVIFGILFLSVFGSYGFVTLRMVNKYQAVKENYYSNNNGNTSLHWVKILPIVFYSYYSLIVVLGIIRMFIPFEFKLINLLIPAYTLFIYIVSFRGYRQKQLMVGLKVPLENQAKKSYEKSGLKVADAENYVKTIKDLMANERPWLNPDVTVNDIAIRTKIPGHYITQVLNEKLRKNFYTLINEYRTEEAIKLFQSPKCKNWTIMSIAYDSGFNSKSSFNSFFKKYTGKTPSEYRKTIKF